MPNQLEQLLLTYEKYSASHALLREAAAAAGLLATIEEEARRQVSAQLRPILQPSRLAGHRRIAADIAAARRRKP